MKQRPCAELHPFEFHLTDIALPVAPCIYLAADAVSARCGRHCARVVVVAAIVLIDFIINAAFDAMQTHMDSLWLPTARGWEPMITKTSRTVTKIAKRRIGRPPDGGFGRVAIKSLETILDGSGTCRAKLF